MKCRLTQLCSLLFVLFIIGGCSTLSDIVPQLPKADNYSLPVGQDIAQANALLAAGKKREAASAYFSASGTFPHKVSDFSNDFHHRFDILNIFII